MRDEWKSPIDHGEASIPSLQGLARVGRQIEKGGSAAAVGGEHDRIAGLTMASRAMKLKAGSKKGSTMNLGYREISARRQVGDAEGVVNAQSSGNTPWWKNVGMEEGM